MNPFTIDVPEADIDDLKRRLAATRYPDEVENAGWDYGTSLPFLRRLVEHWRTCFDWRREEARLNGFPHFIIEVSGERLHFIHARGAGRNVTPILLANGWPSNFVELLPLVPLLTREVDGRSFDVVIPSLPGFGFSGREFSCQPTATCRRPAPGASGTSKTSCVGTKRKRAAISRRWRCHSC